jgi:hypothetical protein
LKSEEALLKAFLQALVFEVLENETHMLEVFLQRATKDTDVIEVECNELVLNSRKMSFIIR